jgi:hypothetical protein
MNTSVTFNEKQTIPHCQNNSKTNNTALSEQFKNKQYRTVGTIQKQTIQHCRNNSKTNNTALSEQFKNKQYRTVGTIQKSNIKIAERGKIDTPYTKIHDHSLSWPHIGISIKRGVLNQFYEHKPPLLLK